MGDQGTVPKALPAWTQLRMVLASAVASLRWERGLALAGLDAVAWEPSADAVCALAGARAGGRAGYGTEEDGRGPEGHSKVRAQGQGAELPGTAALDTGPAPLQQHLAHLSLLGLILPKNSAWASGLCLGNDNNCTSFSLLQQASPCSRSFCQFPNTS